MKRLIALLGVCAFVIVAVVLTRSVTLSERTAGGLTDPLPVARDRVAAHLSEALRFRTVPSRLDDPETRNEFTALRDWLETTYPTFAAATAHAEGGHSSMPPWLTAIGRLARAINRLQERPVPGGIDAITARLLDALAPEMPFVQRLVVRNRWLLGGW